MFYCLIDAKFCKLSFWLMLNFFYICATQCIVMLKPNTGIVKGKDVETGVLWQWKRDTIFKSCVWNDGEKGWTTGLELL